MDRPVPAHTVLSGCARRRVVIPILFTIILLAGITVVSAVVVDYAYTSQWGSFGGGDPGKFNGPKGIAANSTGAVYVADTFNDRMQVFDPSGKFITQWGTTGSGDGQLNEPIGVSFDTTDNVYVADSNNDRVQVFGPSGTFLTKWGSSGSGDGQFSLPSAIAVNQSGKVYVLDTANNRVQVFDSDGVFITKWGSTGSGDGQFKLPGGIVTNASGIVYVGDSDNDRVQVFGISGPFLNKWGSSGSGDGQFDCPAGVVVDSSGNVYVADCTNDRVQEFNALGTFATKWGSTGSGDGQFNNPNSLAINSSGYLYVADTENNRVQLFTPKPVVTSVSSVTGLTTGGETVTIKGAGLAFVSGVKFGTTPAASYTGQSDTEIRAVTPAHTSGTVDILVTAPGGTSLVTAADRFTFIDPPPVPIRGGDDPPAAVPVPGTITVNVGGDSAVNRVTATGTGLSGLIVTGLTTSGPGITGSPAPGTVYQYIELIPARFATITGATISFTVPQSWLDAHHLTPQEIVLFHYTAGTWVALPTTAEKLSNGGVSFTATSPSFSLFAISTTPQAAKNVTTAVPPAAAVAEASADSSVAPASPPVSYRTTAVTPAKTVAAPAPAAGKPQPGLPVTYSAFIAAGLLILAGGGLLVWRWWIHRQNPALFERSD